MRSSSTHGRSVGAVLRRLSPGAAALLVGVLTLPLLIYVLGPSSTLRALFCLSLGAFVGWLGSLVLSTDTQVGILQDILAGAVGALLGLLLFGGMSSAGGAVESVLSSILGAVAVVAIVGFVRGRKKAGRS